MMHLNVVSKHELRVFNGKRAWVPRLHNYQRIVLALLLLVSEMRSVCAAPDAEECRSWTRDITGGGTLTDYPGESFVLLMASSMEGHLSASYGYQYIERKGPVVLHGVEKSEREWAPFVSYEVATRGTTEWKEIGKFTPSHSAPVTIDSTHPRFVFGVGMDPFRAYIGKATWGRVVLENGDFAPIALEDLLPTADCLGYAGNFKKDVDDPDPRRFGSSFNLISLVSFEKHIIGNFYFMGGAEGGSIELIGKQTDDGQFWPVTSFETGGSGKDWIPVKTATPSASLMRVPAYGAGKLRQLRVPLDVLAPLIGKHKFGKIIFSDGQYSVIRLEDLMSKKK
jgi:hypothetical protein